MLKNILLSSMAVMILLGCGGGTSSDFESVSGGSGSDGDPRLVSGYPDQNSFSLAAETLNPEALDYNNVEVPVTVTVGGRFNNPVPGSATVFFVTEGGMVSERCQSEENGVCSGVWRSTGPRPADGRSTVLAFSVGEESFTDVNSNGIFDPGDRFDRFSDVGEAFVDANENGLYDPGEEYFDFDANGRYTKPNGIYDGSLCSQASQNAKKCTPNLVQVQDSIAIVMSGSFVNITFSPSRVTLPAGGSAVVKISLSDVNGQPPPAGTNVSAVTTNGEIVGGAEFTVPNTNWPGPVEFAVVIAADQVGGADAGADEGVGGGGGEDPAFGYLTVTATSPHGITSGAAIEVLD